MKFFVAKVNLAEQKKTGVTYLRPLQFAFESPKFMLPIRLGMANSRGEQDMIVYAFTRTGRVECVNYRTAKVPTDRNVPLFVKERFGAFYKDLFQRAWRREGRNAVFLEYAWDVTPTWGNVCCDPCVGPPPMQQEFVDAGVNWTGGPNGGQAFFTRLHVRYGRDKFPADLMFQTTPDQSRFQARYVLTHPAQGDLQCQAGQTYLEDLYYRRVRELDELTMLTGWDVSKHQDYSNEILMRLPPEKRKGMVAPPVVGPQRPSGGGGGGNNLLIALAALVVLVLLAALQQRRTAAVPA
jgi:MYXO-CTERM domain-containing protein